MKRDFYEVMSYIIISKLYCLAVGQFVEHHGHKPSSYDDVVLMKKIFSVLDMIDADLEATERLLGDKYEIADYIVKSIWDRGIIDVIA